MINDIILLKQGEIVLKGLNRRSFEQKLMSNIKRRLDAIGKFKAYCMQSTVYIEPVDETSDMDAAPAARKTRRRSQSLQLNISRTICSRRRASRPRQSAATRVSP